MLYPEGDGAVVFLDFVAGTLKARRLDSHGVPLGGEITISGRTPSPSTTRGGSGRGRLDPRHLAATCTLRAAFFDGAWNRLGADFPVGSQPFDAQSQPAVAAGGPGNLLVAWAERCPSFPFEPPVPPTGPTAVSRIFAQRFQSPACAAGSEHLCLGQILSDGSQLFDVQVSWRNPYTGETGTAEADRSPATPAPSGSSTRPISR